jgi:hypothetical protein
MSQDHHQTAIARLRDDPDALACIIRCETGCGYVAGDRAAVAVLDHIEKILRKWDAAFADDDGEAA